MNSLNQIQIIGNVTATPEIKETPNGHKVANFSVATNRYWKDSEGNKQEETEFHNIVIWGKLAEIVEQYLEKGKKVFIQGRNQTRSWEDEETGKKRYRTDIVADQMIMLNSAGKPEAQEEGESFGDAPAKPKPAAKKKSPPIEEI